jgi:nicotinamidase-related amidase
MAHLLELQPMNKPALLVIDMLNDFLDAWPAADRERLLQSTRDLLTLLRSHNLPVIWVRQEFEPDLSDAFPEMRAKGIHKNIRGTQGAEIDSTLNVRATDPVIVKKRYSAFFGTTLDDLLRVVQPDAMILAGINTHACIRTTAIDAYQRDWPVVLAADCVASYDKEHHEVSLRYMRDKIASIMSNADIAHALNR